MKSSGISERVLGNAKVESTMKQSRLILINKEHLMACVATAQILISFSMEMEGVAVFTSIAERATIQLLSMKILL